MSLLKGSVFLKLVSLVVALLTYWYIQNEIRGRERDTAVDPSYKLIKLTAKNLPVRLRFETSPPEGYRLMEEQIVVTPSEVTAIGPEAMLEEAVYAQTSTIDVSEYTKTVTKQVPLESVSGIHLVGEPYMVIATVPIERIAQPETKQPAAPAPPEPAETAAPVPAAPTSTSTAPAAS